MQVFKASNFIQKQQPDQLEHPNAMQFIQKQQPDQLEVQHTLAVLHQGDDDVWSMIGLTC
jgi:hypothetical protein